MKIGKFQIDLIDTCIFALDGGAMFGVIPKTLWTKAYNQGDEFNRIPLSSRPLLVRWENKTVLVDAGIGIKLSEKWQKIYNVDNSKSIPEKIIEPFGLKPEDITDVILTHLHFDHAGGATTILNNEIIPSFPNAKYYVQKEQYNWGLNPSEKDRASYFNENYVPLHSMGLLDLLDGDGSIFPGIETISVYGHTKAMQLIKISNGGSTALFCADLFPTKAHIPIPFVMGYDNEPLSTIKEKKKMLPQAYEENWTLIYEHDAFTQASKLINDEKGFRAGEVVVVNE